MTRKVISSYTGEASEVYVSKIVGINEPKSLYRKGEAWKCKAQYGVHPRDGGDKWAVIREGCPDSFLPIFGTQWEAQAVMEWLFENDGSVQVAIHWLNRGDAEPYMQLLTAIHDVALESLGKTRIDEIIEDALDELHQTQEDEFKQLYMAEFKHAEPHPTLGYIPPLDR